MNVLAAGTEDITSTTSLALVLSMQTVSNPAYTNQTLSYSSNHKTNSSKNISLIFKCNSKTEKFII